MTYTIYRRFITLNGKESSYVGFANIDPKYLSDKTYCQVSTKFAKAINCYGWNRFELEYLDYAYTKKDATKLKANYIKKYNSIEDGFNISKNAGGRNSPAILQLSPLGKLISEYPSAIDISKTLGCTTSSIYHCCLVNEIPGQHRTCKGFVWKFK